MKKSKKYLLTIMMMVLVGLIANAASGEKAKMEFKAKTYDFGVLADGKKPVSHEFEFENTGNVPLVILDAKAECGCTRPDYPKAPIPPGKSGRIKVTFNPAGFRGVFEKEVTVRTNGDPKKLKLKIKGTVRK